MSHFFSGLPARLHFQHSIEPLGPIASPWSCHARRGKNIYKTVWKDETVRTMVAAQVTNFKGKWPKAKDKIQANLLPPGQNWVMGQVLANSH